MRVHFTFSRVALVLAVLWMAMGIPAGAFATELTSESPQIVIAEPSTPANLLNYTEYYETADTKTPAPKEAAPAVQVNCCQGCGCGSNECCCDGHWILGIEAVMLSPQFQRRAFADYEVSDEEIYGDYRGGVTSGLFITPRITLGYQGECWGVDVRYWRMEEGADRQMPGIGRNIFDTYGDSGLFRAETLDLEATRLFCWREWTNQLAFGIRYAQLDEATGSSAARVVDDVLFQGSSYARNEFSGTGLTAALSGYRPVNCRCFNLFYSVRGSVLWDNDALNIAQTQSSVMTPDFATAGTDNGALSRGNGTMFIGEVQVGTQWNFQLCRGCADAFVRLALEYQYWNTQNTGGAAAFSDAFVSDGSTILGHAVARSGESSLDLIGFTVATGFTW